MSSFEAVAVSIGDVAVGRPVALFETMELKRAWAGSIEKPMFGAPPNWITSPSSPISCAVAADAAHGGVDFGQRLHLGEQRLVERRDLDTRVLADVEGRIAGDDGVGALVDRREDRVEGLRDRVREDKRARDRRDAEHDREAGEERPELAAPEDSRATLVTQR